MIKKVHKTEEEQRWVYGKFWGNERKEKGDMLQLHYNLKIKTKILKQNKQKLTAIKAIKKLEPESTYLVCIFVFIFLKFLVPYE